VSHKPREATKARKHELTTINAEAAEFADIYWLSGLSEFCVQRRVSNFETHS